MERSGRPIKVNARLLNIVRPFQQPQLEVVDDKVDDTADDKVDDTTDDKVDDNSSNETV